jgi:hypothetical protein
MLNPGESSSVSSNSDNIIVLLVTTEMNHVRSCIQYNI